MKRTALASVTGAGIALVGVTVMVLAWALASAALGEPGAWLGMALVYGPAGLIGGFLAARAAARWYAGPVSGLLAAAVIALLASPDGWALLLSGSLGGAAAGLLHRSRPQP